VRDCRKNLAGTSLDSSLKLLNSKKSVSVKGAFGLIKAQAIFYAHDKNASRRITMKKYGQADVMCAVIHIFLAQQDKLTDKQKKEIESRSCAEINEHYPTAAQWEVER